MVHTIVRNERIGETRGADRVEQTPGERQIKICRRSGRHRARAREQILNNLKPNQLVALHPLQLVQQPVDLPP